MVFSQSISGRAVNDVFVDEPYFMTNPDWFVFDIKSKRYVLTEDAPKKAKASYKQFYEDLDSMVADDKKSKQ